MMRHVKYEKLLAVYGGLDPAARASVEAHLRTCPSCAARLVRYQWVDRSLQALPDRGVPARLWHPWPMRPAARGDTESDRHARSSFGFVFGRALLPASLITVLVAGILLILLSVTGNDRSVTATPTLTLTLTPTATEVAFLGENGGVVVRAGPNIAASRHVSAPPSLTAVWAGAGTPLRTP